jgi:hypothetical protein
MSQVSSEDQQILDALHNAVAEALERKRRLGQYAVVWKDGKPFLIGGDGAEPLPRHLATAESVPSIRR